MLQKCAVVTASIAARRALVENEEASASSIAPLWLEQVLTSQSARASSEDEELHARMLANGNLRANELLVKFEIRVEDTELKLRAYDLRSGREVRGSVPLPMSRGRANNTRNTV